MEKLKFTSWLGALILAVVFATGCGRVNFRLTENNPKMCLMVLSSGLGINVRSLVPGKDLKGLRVRIRDGAWEEIFEIDLNGMRLVTRQGEILREGWRDEEPVGLEEIIYTAWNRAGTYRVTVTHPTLSAGASQTVVVKDGNCGPVRETLTFQLK